MQFLNNSSKKLLVTEMFKVKIGCAPDIMKEIRLYKTYIQHVRFL